jgi:hypothetical protein
MDYSAFDSLLSGEMQLCVPETRIEVTPHESPCGCKLTVRPDNVIDQVVCAEHHAKTARHLFDRQQP